MLSRCSNVIHCHSRWTHSYTFTCRKVQNQISPVCSEVCSIGLKSFERSRKFHKPHSSTFSNFIYSQRDHSQEERTNQYQKIRNCDTKHSPTSHRPFLVNAQFTSLSTRCNIIDSLISDGTLAIRSHRGKVFYFLLPRAYTNVPAQCLSPWASKAPPTNLA